MRREVTGRWREAEPSDYPAIQQCHREMEERVGRKLDLPQFDCPAIAAWWVFERAGQVVQFGYCEKLVEFRMGGLDQEAMHRMVHEKSKEILGATKAAGMRFLHVCVPKEVAAQVGRKLRNAGLYQSENVLYAADLRD